MSAPECDTVAYRMSLFVIFFIYLGTIHSSAAKSVETSCQSEECKRAVSRIVKNMDQSVLPCDNFYEFVCGKYDEELIPQYMKDDLEIIDDMHQAIPSIIQSILEKNSAEEKNKPYGQAFKLYKLCTDQDAMDEQGVSPLQQVIDKIGGWPLVEGEKWREVKWEKVVGKLFELGYDGGLFFDVEFITDQSPPSTDMIWLLPTTFHRFPLKFLNKLMNIAREMGLEAGAHDVSSGELSNIVERFYSLDATEDSLEIMEIEEMINRWPSIDWMTFLSGVFSSSSRITFDKNDYVIVTPGFMDRLVILLAETNNSVIMNYIVAKVIEYSVPYLSPNVAMESSASSSGRSESSLLARRSYCAELTTRELPRLIEAIFAVNHVTDDLHEEVMDLGDKLKKKLMDLIKTSNWLDKAAMKNITERLSNLRFRIGDRNPLEDDYYTKDYVDLELDNSSFLYSMLNINRRKINLSYGQLHLGLNFAPKVSIWDSVIAVNCQYHPSSNTFDIMPGLLQDPLINSNLPKYIEYSGMGSFIGHKLVQDYDKAMKIFYHDRHNESSKIGNVFKGTIECLTVQYEDYFLKKLKLKMDGYEHLAENFADIVSVRLAYSIYQDWVAQHGPDPILADIKYSSTQMFWISYARNRCAKHNPDNSLRFFKDAIHEFRTNGPLANYPEFSEAFDCPAGSPMNPVEKCIVL